MNTKPLSVVHSPAKIPLYFPQSEDQFCDAFVNDGARALVMIVSERANANSSNAQALLAVLYLSGWIDDEDSVGKALEWAQRSAMSANPFGHWALAWCYLEQDLIENGIHEFLASAEQGFGPAYFDLGSFLLNGVCLNRNEKAGISFWRKASSLGHVSATAALEQSALNGYFGTSRKFAATLCMPFVRPIQFMCWALFKKKFSANDLTYVRSIHVENRIRRKYNHAEIGYEAENQLDEMISSLDKK